MSMYRYDPPTPSTTFDGRIRQFVDGPVICDACGCRLQGQPTRPEQDGDTAAWRHFEGLPGRDARGCTVDCVDLVHGANGRVLAAV